MRVRGGQPAPHASASRPPPCRILLSMSASPNGASRLDTEHPCPCPGCSYDLRGLALPCRCPECGGAVEALAARPCPGCAYDLRHVALPSRCPKCGWWVGSLEDVYHPQRFSRRLAVVCAIVGLIFTVTAAHSLMVAQYDAVPFVGLLLAIFGFVVGRRIRASRLRAACAMTCGIASAAPMLTLGIWGLLSALDSYDRMGAAVWAVTGVACGAASMIIFLVFATIGRWSTARQRPR